MANDIFKRHTYLELVKEDGNGEAIRGGCGVEDDGLVGLGGHGGKRAECYW